MVKTAGKGVGGMVKGGARTAGSTVANGAAKAAHKVKAAGSAVVGGVSKAGHAVGSRLR
jgi:hypothetical protein